MLKVEYWFIQSWFLQSSLKFIRNISRIASWTSFWTLICILFFFVVSISIPKSSSTFSLRYRGFVSVKHPVFVQICLDSLRDLLDLRIFLYSSFARIFSVVNVIIHYSSCCYINRINSISITKNDEGFMFCHINIINFYYKTSNCINCFTEVILFSSLRTRMISSRLAWGLTC